MDPQPLNFTKKPTTSWAGLGLIVILAAALGLWTMFTAQNITTIYAQVGNTLAATPSAVDSIEIGKETVKIPTWNLFKSGQIWQLVSSKSQLADNYKPNLVDIPVPHADNPMYTASSISPVLTSLVRAAKKDGVELMVSSAYRSYDDQKNLYNLYETTKGKAFTQAHVAQPGASEHQTGLAVDVSTVTNDCRKDSNLCTLEPAGIQWMNENATKYGFIQRYPSGLQAITGVAGEEWHYRYVGVVLARALSDAGVTFDEFVAKVAPGYIHKK